MGSHPRSPDSDVSARQPGNDHRKEITTFEWLVAAVGALLVIGLVAFLVVDAARADGAPPHLRIRVDSVVALADGDDGYIVTFTAENHARATAADVGIIGELRDGDDAETSHARLDYLPGRSERRGGLLFRRDPRGAVLRVRAEGYQNR